MDDELHKKLDEIALDVASTVDPLPGDCFGFWRQESDESLRNRIEAAIAAKKAKNDGNL